MADKWYKVLVDGRSRHGGDLAWSLPTPNEDGSVTPGAWHEIEGPLSICSSGLHFTREPARWMKPGATVYEVECDGLCAEEDDKGCFRRGRLMRQMTTEELPAVNIYVLGQFAIDRGFAWSSGSATVRAYDSATVEAYGSATVEAYGSATVRAYDSATVEAYDSATVRAYDSATVRAYDSATVIAYDSATVEAYGSATVEAYGSATVRAYDSATVRAYDSATVIAYDSATVRAYDSATVRASGSATVRAYDSATVQLFWGVPTILSAEGHAVVIDRRKSPPVVTMAWQPERVAT